MANLYGVANPLSLPTLANTIGGVNVPCIAGNWTNVIAISSVVPISPGFYYPVVSGNVSILLGATPPTSLAVGFAIGAGSFIQNYTMPAALLTASATVMIPFYLPGYTVVVSFPTGPLTLNIQVFTNPQNSTCLNAGSQAYGWWQRAQDQ